MPDVPLPRFSGMGRASLRRRPERDRAQRKAGRDPRPKAPPMTAQHDVEGLAVKLTEAEKTWLLANEDTPDTPLPPGIADVDWCEGDAIWNAMAELGLSEFWT